MATFKATTVVQEIKWDVQGVPKRNAETGKIEGKWRNGEEHAQGVLNEPDDEVVQEFITQWTDLLDEFSKMAEDPDAAIDDDFYATNRARIVDIAAGVGVPRALLDGLPPRYLRAFFDWLEGELQGEGDSAGTTK